jgi:hypothetical protein
VNSSCVGRIFKEGTARKACSGTSLLCCKRAGMACLQDYIRPCFKHSQQ